MIVGTGIDITEVARVRQLMERYGPRFLQRIFTESEIKYCSAKRNATERFAARFAAKEAASKALGTGIRQGVSWKQMEVTHLPGGRPTLRFSGAAAAIFARLGARQVSLSLSHTAEHAVAQVVLED